VNNFTDNFNFLSESSLKSQDFSEKTEFLIEGFLAKRMITLIYADGGNGKSWCNFAIAKHCAQIGQRVIYLDFDNPLSVLIDRNVDKLLVSQHDNLSYIQRSKYPHTPQELLEQLNNQAVGQIFEGWVFLFDSLRNFVNVKNDHQSMETMTKIMNLREAGATVVILHHSNKDGRNYEGSNNIRNSVDNIYQLEKLDGENGEINMHLRVQKERSSIFDCAYRVDANTLSFTPLDIASATMSSEQEEFVEAVTEELKTYGATNKTALLQAAGRKKDDKTARGWLDQFEGKYWSSAKISGVFTYELVAEHA